MCFGFPDLRRVLLALLLVPAVGFAGPDPAADPGGGDDRPVLRVAADPNNLPFSNAKGEGFENRLAELVAEELGMRLEYVWWPQRRGFFRMMIKERRADLVLGAPAGFEMVRTTQPYYRSTYVFVYPRGAPPVDSFDDPRLAEATIGVQLAGDDFINTPPAHALTARGHINNIRGYTLYGDYGRNSPPAEIIHAVARGEIDVAVAWGPLAGYFARREPVPLEIAPVRPAQDGPTRPFVYAICMGVHRRNEALAERLNDIIDRRREDITRILDAYGVPRVPAAQPEKEADHVAWR